MTINNNGIKQKILRFPLIINIRDNILIILFVIVTFLLIYNQQNIINSQKNAYESNKIAYELKSSSEDLTKYARTFVATGNPKYEKAYWHVLNVRNGLEARPDDEKISLKCLMKQLGFTHKEFEKLIEAQNQSDKLVKKEVIAMNAVKGLRNAATLKLIKPNESNRDFAIRIMNDEAYHKDKETIMEPINEFISIVNSRTQATMKYYNILNYIYILIDIVIIIALISKEKGFSSRMRQKHQKIMDLIDQRNLYIATLTHDLRSPIYSEQKALEIILSKKLGTSLNDFAEYLQDVYKTNEELLRIVNNVLAVFHYESGKLEFNFELINISDLINESIKSIVYLAKDKDSELTISIEPDIPLIKADKDQIFRVLINLLSNAIKHNKKGTAINISAKKIDNAIQVSISDNGGGIQEAERTNIFQRYPSKKRKIGTGLGLYLARQLIKAHGGKIWFDTEVGKGTTFSFMLPAENN